MTAILSPEEVEARLREASKFLAGDYAYDLAAACELAADTLADLRRQLDEARANAEHWTHVAIGDCRRAEAADRAMADLRRQLDDARAECNYLNDQFKACAANESNAVDSYQHLSTDFEECYAECERQRERADDEHDDSIRLHREKCDALDLLRAAEARAEKWQAAAEAEQERIANLLCIAGAWLAADWVRAFPPPTIEPSVTDTEKSDA